MSNKNTTKKFEVRYCTFYTIYRRYSWSLADAYLQMLSHNRLCTHNYLLTELNTAVSRSHSYQHYRASRVLYTISSA
jgi:hypothetical protein